MSSPRPPALLAQGRPTKLANSSTSNNQSSTSTTTSTSTTAKPKSAKELAKADKAARRAAQKGTTQGESTNSAPLTSQGEASAGGKGKASQNAGPQPSSGKHGQTAKGGGGTGGDSNQSSANLASSSSSHNVANNSQTAPSQLDPLQPFLHLDLPMPSSSLSHSSKSSTANIHPSILRLALQYSEFKVVGANARCIAMLEAFKDVSQSRLFTFQYAFP